MNNSKCPACGSSHTVKNGVRNKVQTHVCKDCGYQFRNSRLPSDKEIWRLYQDGKQTIAELSATFGTSPSTIKRRMHQISIEWEQPEIKGSGFVHLDATYWGRKSGILAALDSESGRILYLAFIKHETMADYAEAVSSIEARDYKIKGIIVDGNKHLFSRCSSYNIQMCQFHMKQIVRRYITQNPKLLAARALNGIMDGLTSTTEEKFLEDYNAWKADYSDTINKKSVLKNGQKRYRHRRLRSAMHSIDFYLPYLFTYQKEECKGMPNTNNKIEGTFTDLKKNLNNHSGMREENRKRFISGFFLAST